MTAVVIRIQEPGFPSRELRVATARELVVGRSPSCDLVLVDPAEPPTVSRQHCALDIRPPRAWVRDLASRHGTRVNGEPLRESDPPRMLYSGDLITLGSVALQVTLPELEDGTDSLPRLTGFEIERELGRGSMGVVYLARCGKDLVALKVIHPDRVDSEQHRQRFVREMVVMGQLKHRNIARLVDAGTRGSALFLASEYCAGGTVDSRLQDAGGRLPAPEAVAVARAALEGLAYGHEVQLEGLPVAGVGSGSARGLVHRDIKPQNLFLGGESGRVIKIGDYGLAKAHALAGISGATSTGMVGGTPLFMSRWQAANFKYAGPEVDVWSLAATLYFMITGGPPRDVPAGMSWMEALMSRDPVPVRQRRPEVDARLAQVLDAALRDAGRPEFPTARRLADALGAIA